MFGRKRKEQPQESPKEAPRSESPNPAVVRTINFRSRDDLMYLLAYVDNAPRITGPYETLTDNWRHVLRCLIEVLLEKTDAPT